MVLVFDDFERCNITAVDRLGAINHYVETLGIKTIIVADENHINEDSYSEFKEKVISRTIKYSPDHRLVIAEIIKNYKESSAGYKAFLENHLNILTQVYTESGQGNIRTFKSYIIDFERIYKAWQKSSITMEKMPQVLYAFGAIHFEHKVGNYKKHERYGYLITESKLKDTYSSLISSYQLHSIQKLIVEGMWDEDNFLRDIRLKFSPRTLTFYELFLNWDFWDLDDEIIAKGLPDSLELGYCGGLSSRELVILLQRIYHLMYRQIPLPCNVDYNKLHQGFRFRAEKIKIGEIDEEPNSSIIDPNELPKYDPDAKRLYEDIERTTNQRIHWGYRREFIKYLESPSNSDTSQFRGQCMVSFDDEMLDKFLIAFKSAYNSEKRNLINTLKSIDFDYKEISSDTDIIETTSNLRELSSELKKLQNEEKDSIARYIIEATINSVSDMIVALSAE